MSQKKRKNYLQMDKIIKRLFTLKNKKSIIDFLNAVYGDNISYDAKFDYGDTEINNLDKIKYVTFRADMYIAIKDKDKSYQYALEFQTIFENDMAIRIFRYSFERAVSLKENIENKNHIKITLPKPYLIVLEEEKDLEEKLKLEIAIENGDSFFYNIDVLRYWTYDLDKLYRENLNSYFCDMYGKYGDIDKEVNKMVKTFYDPNIEKRGIEKGMEKGVEKQRLKDIERVKKLLNKKFGTIEEQLKLRIENADIEVLGLIMENILDVETMSIRT